MFVNVAGLALTHKLEGTKAFILLLLHNFLYRLYKASNWLKILPLFSIKRHGNMIQNMLKNF